MLSYTPPIMAVQLFWGKPGGTLTTGGAGTVAVQARGRVVQQFVQDMPVFIFHFFIEA